MNNIKVEHPYCKCTVEHLYWGKVIYMYDEILSRGFGCLEGEDPFSFESTEEDAEDVFIQCLDTLEEEDRMKRFKQLLHGTLAEYRDKVYQTDTKGCETLLAKAQLAQKIIDLLDLDL